MSVIDKRDISNWVKGVKSVHFEMPVYEDEEMLEYTHPNFHAMTGMMSPKVEYDMTEFPDDMLFDADLENMHRNIEELAKDCHRMFLIGHEKLLAKFIERWGG